MTTRPGVFSSPGRSSPNSRTSLAGSVQVTVSELVVGLTDGRTISAPLVWFPLLLAASAQQRAHWELLGNGEGIHWPEIDEDLSVEGLLRGIRVPQPPERGAGITSTSSSADASPKTRRTRSSNLRTPKESSSSLSSSPEEQRCLNCGRPGVLRRLMTRSYGKGRDLIVVEGIPEYSCPHCHEHYIMAGTLHELDHLKAHFRSLPELWRVPVVSFAPARGAA